MMSKKENTGVHGAFSFQGSFFSVLNFTFCVIILTIFKIHILFHISLTESKLSSYKKSSSICVPTTELIWGDMFGK